MELLQLYWISVRSVCLFGGVRICCTQHNINSIFSNKLLLLLLLLLFFLLNLLWIWLFSIEDLFRRFVDQAETKTQINWIKTKEGREKEKKKKHSKNNCILCEMVNNSFHFSGLLCPSRHHKCHHCWQIQIQIQTANKDWWINNR